MADGRTISGILRAALATLLICGAAPAQAQQAYLVTYGPGQDVWERFGHNAIWIHDETIGLDHTYSFGYFEFDRPGFHADFARGSMLYFGAVAARNREFSGYIERDRSIRLQRLNLDPDQVRHLHQLLNDAIMPIPRYYQYDYYFANCSTWIRDLLNTVVDGALAQQWRPLPATQNLRDHTRRLTAGRFWMHTGIMLGLGPLVDRPRSVWEEAFLPERLSEALDKVRVNGEPLITDRQYVHRTARFFPPQKPAMLWPWYLALGFGSAALIALPLRTRRTGWRTAPVKLWILANAVAGTLLLWLSTATAHGATAYNLMLLILNPLWFALLWSGLRNGRMLRCILLAATVLGGLLLAIPGGPQFRLDQILWLLPTNLAALLAVALLRDRSDSDHEPSARAADSGVLRNNRSRA